MTTLNTMVKRLAGLADTTDLNERENSFVKNIVALTDGGKNTTGLSTAQVEWLDDLFHKHFAG